MILVSNDHSQSQHSSFENKGEWVETYPARDHHICYFPVAHQSLCADAEFRSIANP